MRSVAEWVGKTDDSAIPVSVKRRIVERQGGVCALSGMVFTAKDRPEFDHKVPLWLGGTHSEANLHAILGAPHKEKTAREASIRKKVYRVRDKHIGLKPKRPWSHLKKKMNGEVVHRYEKNQDDEN